eukprot:TRINITY_DN4579_c0_g1_i1.p1 TRINITY_DN4579_c0_g1~~TRINITY_DN4579_c0_g1_i1.p1  ORF type:complete len:262 (-),score=67.00 TRINITY_DN4579_c0_g1_i1:141-881(-)
MIALLFVAAASAQVDCEYNGVDWSELGATGDFTGIQSSPTYYYKFNICRQVLATPSGSGCTAGFSAYQTSSSNYCYAALTRPTPQFSDNDDGSISLTYTDSDRLCNSQRTTFKINMICDETATRLPPASTQFLATESPSGSCQYSVNFVSGLACEMKKGGGGGSGGSDGGLSGGSVFLIIFFVGGFVYLAGGYLYKNKKEGAQGTEAIPNIDFWRELPGLVKDGCSFTLNKVRGGGSSGSTYSTVG